MLTVFTIPKPFVGHFGVIQRNAIGALTRLQPRPQILVFGDEPGAAETSRELGVEHVPQVARNEFGTPLIDDVFGRARQRAGDGLLCYLNADIIVMNDFIAAVQRLAAKKRWFLMVGQRWDLDVTDPLAFDDGWDSQLRERVRRDGQLHNITGMDYFVFPPGLVDGIPPMAIGRAMWDNWFLYHARARRAALVDATQSVMAVHQNHDYSHYPTGKPGIHKGPEAQRNKELAGGLDRYFSLRDATHQLTPDGLKRFTDSWHVRRWFLTLPNLHPCWGLPVRVLLKTIALTHPLRAKLGMKLPDPESQGAPTAK